MGAADLSASQTISQSRTTMAMVFIFSAGLLIFGEACRTRHIGLDSYSRWPGSSVSFGYFAVAAGLWFCVAGLMQLVQPARLVLEPTGLTYLGPWWRRQWRWDDVGEFKVENVGAPVIKFRAAAKQTGAGVLDGDRRALIVGGWQMPIDQVCQKLNAARIHWG